MAAEPASAAPRPRPAGTLSVRRDGVESRAGAGEAVEIPAGTGHDWWNDSGDVVHARVDVEATPGSGPMAQRFLETIEVAFGLANSGHTNDGGWLPPRADRG